jgi:hypothetical protein
MMRPEITSARVLAAAVMASTAFALILLLGALVNSPKIAAVAVTGGGTVLVATWLAARSVSTRSAWGRGCLVNGLLSVAVGIGFRLQDEPWSDGSQYMKDLDRAIGPLTHFAWALAAWAGLAALMLAAVLLALSWWLLGPPHRHV